MAATRRGVIAVRKQITLNDNEQWLLCPVCDGNTHIKLLGETDLKNFLLFCQKCKKETKINIQQYKITVIKEPDA